MNIMELSYTMMPYLWLFVNAFRSIYINENKIRTDDCEERTYMIRIVEGSQNNFEETTVFEKNNFEEMTYFG